MYRISSFAKITISDPHHICYTGGLRSQCSLVGKGFGELGTSWLEEHGGIPSGESSRTFMFWVELGVGSSPEVVRGQLILINEDGGFFLLVPPFSTFHFDLDDLVFVRGRIFRTLCFVTRSLYSITIEDVYFEICGGGRLNVSIRIVKKMWTYEPNPEKL